MDWKAITIGILLLGLGYLLGNLLPFYNKTEYVPYKITEKEYHYHDSIIINNTYKTIVNEKFTTDTAYINSVPDSLLWGIIMSKSRQLLKQDSIK